MWAIAIDDPVCMSVSLFVTQLYAVLHANMAEQIKVLFGLETFEDPRNIGLDGSHDLMWSLPNYFGNVLHIVCDIVL